MGVGIRSFFEVFGTDERFLIFAVGSLVLAVALFSMTKGVNFNFGFLALGLGLLFKFRKGTPRER